MNETAYRKLDGLTIEESDIVIRAYRTLDEHFDVAENLPEFEEIIQYINGKRMLKHES